MAGPEQGQGTEQGQEQGQNGYRWNGYRRLVLTALLALSLAVVLWAVLLSVVLDRPFDFADWLLLAIPAGLLGYALRLLFGVSPWDDVLTALRRFLNGSARNRNGNGNVGRVGRQE